MCSTLQVQQWCELRWDTSTRKLTCKLCRLFLKKMSTIYNLASITFLKGTYQKVHAQAMFCKVGAKWLQFSVTHPFPPINILVTLTSIQWKLYVNIMQILLRPANLIETISTNDKYFKCKCLLFYLWWWWYRVVTALQSR